MKLFQVLISALLLANSLPVTAQQKRQPAKPTRRPTQTTVTPAASQTFDNLLPSETYKLYIEVRGVGQVIRSNSFNDVIDPVLKLAGPPKEFRTFIKWLNAHAEEVTTSRMFLATWTSSKKVPEVVIAIEFPTIEDATKFEPQLNTFLPKVLPTPTPGPNPTPSPATEPAQAQAVQTQAVKPDEPPKPSYFLKRFGSLIVLTPTELNIKALKPSGSKPLSEDPTFRTARNRFTSEQLFAFVDFKIVLNEEEERKSEMRAERKRAEEEAASQKTDTAQPNTDPLTATQDVGPVPIPEEQPKPDQKEPQPPEMLSALGSIFAGSFFGGEASWPQAIGVAASLEPDSFDVRALLINTPGEKIDALPLLPRLITAAPVATEAPTILPADTEFLVAMSLDLPQIHAAMSKPNVPGLTEAELQTARPFADLEQRAKIDIAKDLLPLLGNEVAVTMSMNYLDIAPTSPQKDDETPESNSETSKTTGPSPVVALSLRDKEGMRNLLPKIVEGLGFKGVGVLAKTERRDDTETVSYGNALTYAFIKNFIVLSTDANAVRHVVDSYLKQETLSSDLKFKNSNRWQPRQVQAQVYISPALMESYKTWANQPTTLLSDQTRDFMGKLGVIAHPVTYSLSTEGAGVLHEVHVPKDLVLMAVAGLAEGSNPSELVSNERSTIAAMYSISYAQIQYKDGKGAGSFGTLDQLIEENMVRKDLIEKHGYKFELILTGNRFEITAVPAEYGKTGKTSYYIDEKNVLRGGDHGGGTASMSDRRIQP